METLLVIERLNRLAITEAVFIQMAVSSLFSKDAAKDFSKAVKRLTTDG